MLRRISERHFDSFSLRKRIFFIISLSKFNQEKIYWWLHTATVWEIGPLIVSSPGHPRSERIWQLSECITWESGENRQTKQKQPRWLCFPSLQGNAIREAFTHKEAFSFLKGQIFFKCPPFKKYLHWFYFYQKTCFPHIFCKQIYVNSIEKSQRKPQTIPTSQDLSPASFSCFSPRYKYQMQESANAESTEFVELVQVFG